MCNSHVQQCSCNNVQNPLNMHAHTHGSPTLMCNSHVQQRSCNNVQDPLNMHAHTHMHACMDLQLSCATLMCNNVHMPWCNTKCFPFLGIQTALHCFLSSICIYSTSAPLAELIAFWTALQQISKSQNIQTCIYSSSAPLTLQIGFWALIHAKYSHLHNFLSAFIPPGNACCTSLLPCPMHHLVDACTCLAWLRLSCLPTCIFIHPLAHACAPSQPATRVYGTSPS